MPTQAYRKGVPDIDLALAAVLQVLTTDRHFRQMGFRMLPDARLPKARRMKTRSARRPTRRR